MGPKEEPNKKIYVVGVQGNLKTGPDIEAFYAHIRKLRSDNINRIVIDLRSLDWISSLGLGALISCMTTMRKAGGDICLCSPKDKIKSLFNITKLDQVFKIYDTCDMAIKDFDKVLH